MNKVPMSWKIFDSHKKSSGIHIHKSLWDKNKNFKGRVLQKLKSKASLLIKANTKNTSSLTFLTFYPSQDSLKIFPSN
jgi:glutamine synthetase